MSFHPKGQSLRLSRSEIAVRAVLTDDSKRRAVALWRKRVPGLKTLITAKESK